MSRPRLAAFPKCYLEALRQPGTMTWFDWIEMAATIRHLEGLELWPPALAGFDLPYLRRVRTAGEARGLRTPMACASPDFTQFAESDRAAEIEEHRTLLRVANRLGCRTFRVLSGQRRPGIERADGIAWTVDAIESLLPDARWLDIILVLENHYKDVSWEYPEFAQSVDIFLEIVERIDSPWFGINYDPSNALIAGEDPLALLELVKSRVVSMHASDRSLVSGTLRDLQRMDTDPMLGYAPYIHHGVLGQGLIDYDAIFQVLAEIGFDGWISIEDGQDPKTGLKDLRASAEFLNGKIRQHWKLA